MPKRLKSVKNRNKSRWWTRVACRSKMLKVVQSQNATIPEILIWIAITDGGQSVFELKPTVVAHGQCSPGQSYSYFSPAWLFPAMTVWRCRREERKHDHLPCRTSTHTHPAPPPRPGIGIGRCRLLQCL